MTGILNPLLHLNFTSQLLHHTTASNLASSYTPTGTRLSSHWLRVRITTFINDFSSTLTGRGLTRVYSYTKYSQLVYSVNRFADCNRLLRYETNN